MRRAWPLLALVAVFVAASLALPQHARAQDLAVSIVSPTPGAIVGPQVEVIAETIGPVVVVAFDASSDGGLTWVPIAEDRDPTDGWVATWVTAGTEGPAQLRATASDGTATAIAAVEVTIDGTPPSLSLGSSRDAFSPNDDGRAERTVVHVRVEEAVTVTLQVVRPDGSVVRRLAEDEPAGPQDAHIAWRGRTRTGRIAADGAYRFRAEVTDALGNVAVAELKVVLDTRPPSFRWLGADPDPLRRTGPVTFSLRTTDRSQVIVVSSTITDVLGRRVLRLEPVEAEGGQLQLPWDGRDRDGNPADPGLYRVGFRLTDDAGNRRETTPRPFRDHRPVTTRLIRRVEGTGGLVALTFDDCGDASAWDRILDVLDARHATASFFCGAPRVLANPSLARRTVAGGHTVGSHGWDHADLTTLSSGAIRERLVRDADAWWRVARATAVPFLRPPYGAVNATVLAAAGAEGYGVTVLWDVDPWDWAGGGAAGIAAKVLSASRSGSIVVLHTKSGTASALPAIVRGLRSRGLEPVSLAQLLATGG